MKIEGVEFFDCSEEEEVKTLQSLRHIRKDINKTSYSTEDLNKLIKAIIAFHYKLRVAGTLFNLRYKNSNKIAVRYKKSSSKSARIFSMDVVPLGTLSHSGRKKNMGISKRYIPYEDNSKFYGYVDTLYLPRLKDSTPQRTIEDMITEVACGIDDRENVKLATVEFSIELMSVILEEYYFSADKQDIKDRMQRSANVKKILNSETPVELFSDIDNRYMAHYLTVQNVCYALNKNELSNDRIKDVLVDFKLEVIKEWYNIYKEGLDKYVESAEGDSELNALTAIFFDVVKELGIEISLKRDKIRHSLTQDEIKEIADTITIFETSCIYWRVSDLLAALTIRVPDVVNWLQRLHGQLTWKTEIAASLNNGEKMEQMLRIMNVGRVRVYRSWEKTESE